MVYTDKTATAFQFETHIRRIISEIRSAMLEKIAKLDQQLIFIERSRGLFAQNLVQSLNVLKFIY